MKREATPAGLGAVVTLLTWIVIAVALVAAFANFPTATAWTIMAAMVIGVISPLVSSFIKAVK